MSDEEINKIIAEYMGAEINGSHLVLLEEIEGSTEKADAWYDLYTESLDSLVPVVEKIDTYISLSFSVGLWRAKGDGIDEVYYDKSPARALALAVCEAIRSMGNE